MQYTTAILSLAGIAAATPFKFPLSNGFPNPAPSQIPVIEKNAGGTLPNGALPTSLGPNGHLDFQVIAVNEIFEVAFFTSLYKNITNGVAGYEPNGWDKDKIAADIFAIRAQEELHALGANAILKSAGYPAIEPCEYIFPATTFDEAIVLANTFTDVVLGTLQQVQGQLGAEGGAELSALVPLVGSIIGQEGQQDGVYRYLQNKVPSASPFLTTSAGQFAFNAVNQLFIVPGSCPNPPDVPIFEPLSVVQQPPAQNTTVSFTTPAAASTAQHIAYISGQNSPVVVPVSSVSTSGKTRTVTASFPFEAGFSNGLTIAALVNSAGPFASAADVAAATIAGPGLIEVN